MNEIEIKNVIPDVQGSPQHGICQKTQNITNETPTLNRRLTYGKKEPSALNRRLRKVLGETSAMNIRLRKGHEELVALNRRVMEGQEEPLF